MTPRSLLLVALGGSGPARRAGGADCAKDTAFPSARAEQKIQLYPNPAPANPVGMKFRPINAKEANAQYRR